MNRVLKILGFAGSLRDGSYNRALLRVAADLVPKDTKLDIFDLEGIPPFNQDLEKSMPEKVKEFKAKIRAADAILIATPEANYTLPGVLTNAMNWASRPHGDNAFDGKPVAVMGATVGMLGTARAQYHLRQVCVFLDLHLLNKPEVFCNAFSDSFDQNGKLVDKRIQELISSQLSAFQSWTNRIRATERSIA